MSLLARLLAWLYPDPPATAQRRRRLRAVCEYCGKDLAVIASTGKLWKHTCAAPSPSVLAELTPEVRALIAQEPR